MAKKEEKTETDTVDLTTVENVTIKPGLETLEFCFLIVVLLGNIAAVFADKMPASWAGVAAIIAAAAYAISRGLTKNG